RRWYRGANAPIERSNSADIRCAERLLLQDVAVGRASRGRPGQGRAPKLCFDKPLRQHYLGKIDSRQWRDFTVSAPIHSSTCVAALVACAWTAPLRAQTVAEVQVAPQTLTLGVGQKQTIFAAAFDRAGNLISNARFSFWTSDSSIARVQSD